MDKENTNIDQSKRSFVKKAAYTAPVIVSMTAIPSFASAGSGWQPQSQTQSHRSDRRANDTHRGQSRRST